MSQYLKERLIGGNRRHRLFSCVAFLGRRHLGFVGILKSVTLVTVRSSSLGRVIIDRGMEVDFGNVWGRTSSLPCPCNLCGNACGAWPACQGYLVMIYYGFSRPLTGPQSSGRCLFAVLDGVWDIFGRAFRSACTFSGAGILGTWRTS